MHYITHIQVNFGLNSLSSTSNEQLFELFVCKCCAKLTQQIESEVIIKSNFNSKFFANEIAESKCSI